MACCTTVAILVLAAAVGGLRCRDRRDGAVLGKNLLWLAGEPRHQGTGVHPAPKRQVLPPMPGYIPVYIQHGDAAPEDTVELAELFRTADSNQPPTDAVQDSILSVSVPDTDTSVAISHVDESPAPPSVGDESQNNDVDSNTDIEKQPASDENIEHFPTKNESPLNTELGNLPDNLEISPDMLPAMIDASKQDAEESMNLESEKEQEPPSTEISETETSTLAENSTSV